MTEEVKKPGRPRKPTTPVVKNLMRAPYRIAGVVLMPEQSGEVPKFKTDNKFMQRLIEKGCIEVS